MHKRLFPSVVPLKSVFEVKIVTSKSNRGCISKENDNQTCVMTNGKLLVCLFFTFLAVLFLHVTCDWSQNNEHPVNIFWTQSRFCDSHCAVNATHRKTSLLRLTLIQLLLRFFCPPLLLLLA